MDIRVLRYFLAVAHEENITRAAESLHISQPSLSKQLHELEAELGKPLLVRGKRKITLTEAGVLLRRRAEEIVSLFDRTEEELHAADRDLSGEIVLGGKPTPSILRAAAVLHRDCPGVRFAFYDSDATEVSERLQHGSIEFGILLHPVDPMTYESLPLTDESRWGLLVPSDCPLAQKSAITSADLRTAPLIYHRRAGLQRLISLWAGTEPEQLNVAATYNVVNNNPAYYVRSGLGYFLTTEDRLPTTLEPDVRFPLLDPPLYSHYALVWKRHAAFSRPAQAFLDCVRRIQQEEHEAQSASGSPRG